MLGHHPRFALLLPQWLAQLDQCAVRLPLVKRVLQVFWHRLYWSWSRRLYVVIHLGRNKSPLHLHQVLNCLHYLQWHLPNAPECGNRYQPNQSLHQKAVSIQACHALFVLVQANASHLAHQSNGHYGVHLVQAEVNLGHIYLGELNNIRWLPLERFHGHHKQ
ncbi:Uncharacterised protein [Acinetobacter baumannii]|nr:Uncharacterised protein [Acinetobacter baumannii]SSU18316.1 Uncharacterised protein [Acinetobacter baumannii]SSU45050.1 Uncharacterised protein [Acinetobacter baumannii]